MAANELLLFFSTPSARSTAATAALWRVAATHGWAEQGHLTLAHPWPIQPGPRNQMMKRLMKQPSQTLSGMVLKAMMQLKRANCTGMKTDLPSEVEIEKCLD